MSISQTKKKKKIDNTEYFVVIYNTAQILSVLFHYFLELFIEKYIIIFCTTQVDERNEQKTQIKTANEQTI